MEAVHFRETLAPTDEYTLRQDPEEHHNLPRRRENLKAHLLWLVRRLQIVTKT
jgi:hypothetical protein